MSDAPTSREIMTIVASRHLKNETSCFVGIGIPSMAANLARLTHAPDIVLIYESGTIGAKPDILPLSIGDGELAETADSVVSTPEIFSYWLQGGRIHTGFLGAAQVDKFANLNSTVIGDYPSPKVRLPGAGGAPEIAALAHETIIIIDHDWRKLVEKVHFVTSPGYLNGGDAREKAGLSGGPVAVITDLGVLVPHPETKELIVSHLHPGVSRDDISKATGWELKFADDVAETSAPTRDELQTLRDLMKRTNEARGGKS